MTYKKSKKNKVVQFRSAAIKKLATIYQAHYLYVFNAGHQYHGRKILHKSAFSPLACRIDKLCILSHTSKTSRAERLPTSLERERKGERGKKNMSACTLAAAHE